MRKTKLLKMISMMNLQSRKKSLRKEKHRILANKRIPVKIPDMIIAVLMALCQIALAEAP